MDVSELNLGDAIKVADLKLENVTIFNDENAAIVSVVAPKIVEEPETGEEEDEDAEPEVIGKGKSDDEGDESEEKSEDKE